MTTTTAMAATTARAVLALTGALAGLCFWGLVDGMERDILTERGMLFLFALAFAFFTIVLAHAGPVTIRRAAPAAAVIALVLAGALWLGAGRHDRVEPYIKLGYPLMAYGMALLIATPLAGGLLTGGRGGWRDYPLLFRLSWQIVVRFLAAALFTGLFWGLLSLSDALLRIVGVELIAFLTRGDVVVWVLSGAMFGLALAVVEELTEFLSPYLLLRLMRLFLPVVLVVSALFLVLLPVRGWDGLLSGFSPAGTLIAFAVAAIVLVTVALERDDIDAAQAPAMRAAVQAMALLVPVLAGLAVWAVWMRIGQYGYTPDRLVALTLAAVALLYGLAHAGAVLLRGAWMARVRAANIRLALASVAICLAWLVVVHPEKIAAQSQIARAAAGLPAEDLPLGALARDWGRAGQDALAQIEALRPDLAEAIASAHQGRGTGPVSAARRMAALLPVYPESAALPDLALSDLAADWLFRLETSCANRIPEGPGCALVLARFAPQDPAPRGLLFQRWAEDQVQVTAMTLREGRLVVEGRAGIHGATGGFASLDDATLAALHRGEIALEPSDRLVLKLRDREIFPHN